MVAAADARARRDEAALTAVLSDWLDEMLGVVQARMRSPRARRGTRLWATESPMVIDLDQPAREVKAAEYKAVDPGYVVPGTRGLGDRVRPVAITIVRDGAAGLADRLGLDGVVDGVIDDPGGGGMFSFDVEELNDAVEDAVAAMIGVGERHAEALRRAILDADADEGDLDDVLDAIAAAHRRGGGWVLLHGRTLANALRNRAELETARAAGVTHLQWASKRDARVRPEHVYADGQVRPIGNGFRVGVFQLDFPGDPKDLPASGSMVWGCRCSMLMAWPDERTRQALREVEAAAADPEHSANLAAQRAHFAATRPGVPLLSAIDDPGPPVPQIVLDAPMVGYRMLPEGPDGAALQPGQQISMTDPLVLALRAPREAVGAVVLGVSLPAGTVVGAAEGMLVLPAQTGAAGAGTTLSVSAATSTSVTAVPLTA